MTNKIIIFRKQAKISVLGAIINILKTKGMMVGRQKTTDSAAMLSA
jgi:hypothetical protein